MNRNVRCPESLPPTHSRIQAESATTPTVTKKHKLAAFLTCCLALGLSHAWAQTATNVYVDPSAGWIGYINAWSTTNLPVSGPPFASGAVATSELDAGFAGAVASFAPSTQADSIPTNDVTYSEYWNPDGSPNAIIDANFYVQNDTLAGDTVTFSGYCWTNTLIGPYNSNIVAFIKDFVPGYSSFTSVTTNLNGGIFTLTLATTAGDHIQYGFEMQGPPQHSTNENAAGSVIIASNPPPAGPAVTSITPAPVSVLITSNATISATATGSGLTYQWQKNGVNLANSSSVSGSTTPTLTLSNVNGNAEASYTIVVTDSALRKASASTFLVVFDPTNLSFDPNLPFNGFINAWTNDNGTVGAYDAGFGYPTGLLRANIVNGTAVLQPNTSLFNASDPFWGPGGQPGQWVEADYFIGNDILAGQGLSLTFSGFCPSNSLPAPYVASAWIEDFAPDYSSLNSMTTNLVAGQPFSITLNTIVQAGRHIQYGLRLFGLDNPPSDPDTATAALVTPPQPSLSATLSNNAINLSFPASALGHNYTVQYKTNLTDPTWQTLTTVPGIDAVQNVADPVGPASSRFYRVYVR